MVTQVDLSPSHRKVHPFYEYLGWFRVHNLTNERPSGLFASRPRHGGSREGLGTLHCC